MRKIDHQTVQRILDAADIVEVVSDFVTLKRRGANYIGLCPFHNERTPSFSVSKSRGICKCFSCGKGGSPVNFLMELEGMTYQEALRWLAKKYGIEIKERELSDKEIQDAAERESLFAVNEFAQRFFEETMANTDEGRDVGMAYFRERGISEASVKKFHLGYAPEKSNALYEAATAAGYEAQYLEKTGLCMRNDRGVYDRFRARVIYPVHGLSGRVVAFGGRTLRTDKKMAKYVNSPESTIYSKKNELYGLYQARQAITRKDKCILVEGYMDVISMHQSGVENVVASSGTSLTEEQIRVIHRFTKNVTVVYDSDAAGIKASLRGIDMLLEQGLNVKVLSLPDGDDPDSYAQNHSNEEVERYFSEHETDFIHFKSDIMLRDAGTDPIRRANAIADIIRSVAVIPDPIVRQVYIEECSRYFEMDEGLLVRQMAVYMAQKEEERDKQRRRQEASASLEHPRGENPDTEKIDPVSDNPALASPALAQALAGGGKNGGKMDSGDSDAKRRRFMAPYERELLRYALRYGMMDLCEVIQDDDSRVPLTVLDFIRSEMQADALEWLNDAHAALWKRICTLGDNWKTDSEAERQRSVDSEAKTEEMEQYARHYCERILCSDSDDAVRMLATQLASDRHQLPRSQAERIEPEESRLRELVPRAVYELKNATLLCNISDVQARLRDASANGGDVAPIIAELMELNRLKTEFGKYLGERIITPNKP